MAPEIFTTGNPRRPLGRRILPGEKDEAIRSKAGNLSNAASECIRQGNEKKAKILLGKLGMDKELARCLVEAALENRPGVAVRFETVFLEPERIGGPREYKNFRMGEK